MRTTIRLNDQLFADVKRLAAETGRTLTAVIEDSLRQALARRKSERPRRPIKLKTFRGKGLHPGVDLDDSAALRELMDRENAPS